MAVAIQSVKEVTSAAFALTVRAEFCPPLTGGYSERSTW